MDKKYITFQNVKPPELTADEMASLLAEYPGLANQQSWKITLAPMTAEETAARQANDIEIARELGII